MRSADLIAGLAAGVVCAPLLWRRNLTGLVPPLLGVTVAVALVARDQAEPWLVAVTAVAGLAAAAGSRISPAVRLGVLAAVAVAVAWQAPADPTGAGPALVVAIGLGGLGATVAETDTRWLAGVLLLGSAGGVFLAVADTEAAVIVTAGLGVGAGLVGVGTWRPQAPYQRLAGAWVGPVALVCWAAAWGARGRPLGLPGGLACLGVLLGLAAVAGWRDGAWRAVVLVVVQAAAVLAGARWATDAGDLAAAWGRAVLVVGGATVLVAAVGVTGRHPPPVPEVS